MNPRRPGARRLLVAACLCAAVAAREAGADGDLYLAAPEGGDPASLGSAAGAMARRCADYGLDGAEAKVVAAGDGKVVRLSRPKGFSPSMTLAVGKLAAMAFRIVELRIYYAATVEEAQRMVTNKDLPLHRWPAPKGAKWHIQLADVPDAIDRYAAATQSPLPLQEQPFIAGGAFSKMRWEGRAVPLTYAVGPGAAQTFTSRLPPGAGYGYNLVVDGYFLHGVAWEFDPYGDKDLVVACPFCNGTGQEGDAAANSGARAGAAEKAPCRKCKGKGKANLNPDKNRPWMRLKAAKGEFADAMLPHPLPYPLRVLTDEEARKIAAGLPPEPKPAAGTDATAAGAPPPTGPAPAAPIEQPAPALPASSDKECAKWLLLAKNFYNARNLGEAEENVKKALAKCAEGKAADEAKDLLKKIETLKNP